MIFWLLALLSIFLTFRWGDWRNWSKYYPTITFWIIGNYLYDTLTYNKPLWLYYAPFLNHTLNDLSWKFITYPCIAMIFLYHFPESRISAKVRYTVLWIMAFSIMEWLLFTFGYFLYYNGWNIWWSVAFNFMMFPLLRIHIKSPSLSWIIAIIVGLTIIVVFKIPVMNLR